MNERELPGIVLTIAELRALDDALDEAEKVYRSNPSAYARQLSDPAFDRLLEKVEESLLRHARGGKFADVHAAKARRAARVSYSEVQALSQLADGEVKELFAINTGLYTGLLHRGLIEFRKKGGGRWTARITLSGKDALERASQLGAPTGR